MKKCNNVECPTIGDNISWEDTVDVCPICHKPIFNVSISNMIDTELSEFVELKDTDFINCNVLVATPIPFRISTYMIYDVEKDIEKSIKVHVVEEINRLKVDINNMRTEIINEVKQLENKFESFVISDRTKMGNMYRTNINEIEKTGGLSEGENDRINLLKDFINEGKMKVDKIEKEIPRYEVKDEIVPKKSEVKVGKDEMLIGNFIINKKALGAFILVIMIIVLFSISQFLKI